MACPFPGMDPWLESPSVWPDFHNALAGEIRAALNGSLPNPYYAQLNVREELTITSEALTRHIVPDVSIHSPQGNGGGVASAVLVGPRTDVAEFEEIEVFSEPSEVNFVEIRDAKSGHEVVTLIEILSPSNKQPGKDHDAYLEKREAILGSTASLVEIDLLRAGSRELFGGDVHERLLRYAPPLDYVVTVQRAWKRRLANHYQLFPIRLTDCLPVIAIPLREGDVEVTLDLQYAFQETYNRGPYARGAVDYGRPAEPPLREDLGVWAAERLRAR